MHHFDGAACQAEGQGPDGVLPAPVEQVVEAGQGPLPLVGLEVDLVGRPRLHLAAIVRRHGLR